MKEIFIGLDVHKKSWSVAIHDEQHFIKCFSMNPDAALLIEHINHHYPNTTVSCCYESGCCGYHIYRDLITANWKVLVVNPGDIPRINKQSSFKTDKIDSRYLSLQLAVGNLKSIHVPEPEQEQCRSLFRRRNDLVKEQRRIKCHIKSMLLYYGVIIPPKYDTSTWSKEMKSWLKDLQWQYDAAHQTIQSRLRHLEFLQQEYLQVGNELRKYARAHYRQDYYLLRSIPGIGPLTSIAMLVEVGNVRRFKSIDRLSCYVGLVPSIHSSGDRTYTKGITKRSKHLLRSYLIEAAWIATKKDPPLKKYYEDRSGTEHKKLIIKIAAKLLNRIYHVIKSGEPYRIAEPEEAGLVKT